MSYYIYIHTNKINNKRYVGVTSQSPKQRWGKNGKGYANQKKFYNAILKYGWDNFEHQYWEVDSEKDMLYGEHYLIKFYDSINNGYNTVCGGKKYRAGFKKDNCLIDIHLRDYDSRKEYYKAYHRECIRHKDPIFCTLSVYELKTQ